MSGRGFVYAFIHPQSPENLDGFVRVKIGHSTAPPWGSKHELRGEKLAFGFEMFGFERPVDFFSPFETRSSKSAESALKAYCREQGWIIDPKKRGRSTEVFRIPVDQGPALRKFLEANF